MQVMHYLIQREIERLCEHMNDSVLTSLLLLRYLSECGAPPSLLPNGEDSLWEIVQSDQIGGSIASITRALKQVERQYPFVRELIDRNEAQSVDESALRKLISLLSEIVLLYSLVELDGGSERKNVLKHIQENGYWCKNDQNDVSRTTRNEKAWRNDFSYERQHLVEQGYMQPGLKGIWRITESGRQYVDALAERLRTMPFEADTCFTAIFHQKLFQTHIHPELTADQILLEQLLQAEDIPEDSPASFSDEPRPKGPVAGRAGNQNAYLRDPAVARRALARAGHRCEADAAHPSFLRKDSACLYMEPHHLIPMSMTDAFGVSLDREQNIFSLCSNCHNQIHYGAREDVRRLVARLFLSREAEICGILGRKITLEELYQIYRVS